MVNRNYKKKRYNREIKVIYTKTKPQADYHHGVSSLQTYDDHYRISVWEGLSKTRKELERRSQELSKQAGRPVGAVSQQRALRHELWHIHKPHASEKQIRRIETKQLPRRLPPKQRNYSK
jgi:hypothetical protein